MKKKELLKMDDKKLDAAVKIQGTEFDRKRKISGVTVAKMAKLFKKGKSYKDIAAQFGVSLLAVQYNLDPEFKKKFNASRNGKHTGVDKVTFENRVAYKRKLVATGAKVAICI